MSIVQPDVTLLMDMHGVIRRATLSGDTSEGVSDEWVGRPWGETVDSAGSEKVRTMVEDARQSGFSAFRQVTHVLPSGRELPIEYTIVRLGRKSGLLAIGKSLQAVAELQSRLVAAQQAMERDYWKLREIEARYRLLFDASTEAVLLVKASDLTITEANPTAKRALGPTIGDAIQGHASVLDAVAPADRDKLQAILTRVQDNGKTPGSLLRIGGAEESWIVRASLMTSQQGLFFLLQLSPTGKVGDTSEGTDGDQFRRLVEGIPDSFVVIGCDGTVEAANQSFLEMIQVPSRPAIIGQHVGRWLGQPGADFNVLLSSMRSTGAVRLFPTLVRGELGTDTQVELSAGSMAGADGESIGIVIRDVGARLPPASDRHRVFNGLSALTGQIGRKPLRKLVKDAVEELERHYIEASLAMTDGNRTAAAELLGLSRQSLYAKLSRYGFDGSVDPAIN